MEETRYLDSIYFRKLQALHKETFFKKAEVRQLSKKKPTNFILKRIATIYFVGGGNRWSYTDKIGDGQFHSSAAALPRMLQFDRCHFIDTFNDKVRKTKQIKGSTGCHAPCLP